MRSPIGSVLLVDDHPGVLHALASAFRGQGFAVEIAVDHDEALARAAARRPDLAVVDLYLPGRSGLEVVQSLRALDPAIEVIVLTGDADSETMTDAVRLGAINVLQKPKTPREILDAVARAHAPPTVVLPPQETRVQTISLTVRQHMLRVLAICHGNLSRAARLLGIARTTLQRKLKKGT